MSETEAKSYRELARLVGRSVSTVHAWAKDTRWRFGEAPWTAAQVTKIRLWADQELDRDEQALAGAGGMPIDAHGLSITGRANLALKIERTKKLKLEREIMLKEYHNAEECKRRHIAQIIDVRNALLAMGKHLAPKLAAAQPTEFQKIIDTATHEICDAFADGREPVFR